MFPRGQAKSPKVRSFVDFLLQRLNFDTDYMEVLCPNRKCYEAALPATAFEENGAAEPVELSHAVIAEVQKAHSTKMPRRRSARGGLVTIDSRHRHCDPAPGGAGGSRDAFPAKRG